MARSKREYDAARYAANRAAVIARTAAHGRAHPEQRRAATKRFRQKNRESLRLAARRRYDPEKQRLANQALPLARRLVYAAKHRAKRMRIPFDLTPDDVVVPLRCPVLGTKLVRGRRRMQPDSPTLDRVVPARGYVKGNVQVISLRANTMKGTATLAELERLVSWLRSVS